MVEYSVWVNTDSMARVHFLVVSDDYPFLLQPILVNGISFYVKCVALGLLDVKILIYIFFSTPKLKTFLDRNEIRNSAMKVFCISFDTTHNVQPKSILHLPKLTRYFD